MTPTLLIIDDEKEVCHCIEDIFKEEEPSYRLLTADNGEDGIRMCKESRPDVIILDLRLNAALNGIDTFNQIRQCYPGGKVIIFTGYANEQEEARLKDMGVDAYVTKPVTPPEILAVVRRLVERKKSEDVHG